MPPRAEGRRGVGSGEGGSLALPPLSILTKDLDTYRFLSGLLAQRGINPIKIGQPVIERSQRDV